MGAIYILWLRQLKRYWRSRARMVAALAQPVLFLIALGLGFGPIVERAGGGDYIQFLAPGIIVMTILFTSMFSGIEVVWDRQFGFLKETLVAPIPRWKIMLGRTLGGSTVAMLQAIIVLIITMFLGFKPVLALLPLSLLFTFLVALVFTSLGTAIASKLEDMQAFPLVMNFLIMPIFFLSGTLFPLSNLPKALEIITKLNPLTYGVDAIRSTLTGTLASALVIDSAILGSLVIIIGAIGVYMFYQAEI